MPITKSKNEKIQNILQNCNGYLERNIHSEMFCMPENELEYYYFLKFAAGSVLMHNALIENFKIQEHYYDSLKKVDYFVVEKKEDIFYCFAIYTDFIRNVALYKNFKTNFIKEFQFVNPPSSAYSFKNVADVARRYRIPYPYEIPYLFEHCSTFNI